ncbi:MAG: hypothetical protein ACLSGS_04335 [Adlercreutzia sp.]
MLQIAVAKRYGSRSTPFATTSASARPHVTRLPNGLRLRRVRLRLVEFIRCMRESGVQIEALVEYVALFQVRAHRRRLP